MTDHQPPSLSHPLRVVCACGHIGTYDDMDTFEQAGGRLVYHRDSDLFAATCPTCTTGCPVRAGLFSWDDGTELCLALGRFEDGYTPLDDTLHGEYNPNQTVFDQVADPVYIARQRLDPTCLRCGSRITDAEYREDADAPQIGYEYYECSECGNHMRPEAIDAQSDDQ